MSNAKLHFALLKSNIVTLIIYIHNYVYPKYVQSCETSSYPKTYLDFMFIIMIHILVNHAERHVTQQTCPKAMENPYIKRIY